MTQSLAGAGVKFGGSGDQTTAAMGMMRNKQLELEEDKVGRSKSTLSDPSSNRPELSA